MLAAFNSQATVLSQELSQHDACGESDISGTSGNDPFGVSAADLIDASGIFSSRFGQIQFRAYEGKQLSAYTYRATQFDAKHGPVWFVMHGAKRNAEHYLKMAAPVAERHQALAIAIEFSRDDYPTGDDYTLGVTTHGNADATAYSEGRWRKTDAYLYAEIERVFEAVHRLIDGKQRGYYLFGHSAGAQFTHRLITFLPAARVLGAVAANAGWYTLPVRRNGSRFTLPYGLRCTPLGKNDMRPILAAPLTLLLGTRDTTTPATDSMVRGTPEAMAQGATRLARGFHYFRSGQSSARSIDTEFSWRLALAPGAEHNVRQVIASAGFLLFTPERSSCGSSPAADAGKLVVNEVLADPPRGKRGDSNNDGVRDPAADEFVEFVNAGETALCLAGWTLIDASGQQRHLFPLGPALKPGQALVVFGGGVPTGQFGVAAVQRATSVSGLSLSNAGDVLTLRDSTGRLAKQFSWGDCASGSCADDHHSGELGFAGSLVRWPELVGGWQRHRNVAKQNFSPGIRANGLAWGFKK